MPSPPPEHDRTESTVIGFSIAGTNTFLYHIALGRGTQNYTCENPTAAAKPVAIGAVATLFNVTSLAYLSVDLLDILTVTASIWKPPHHNVSLVKDSMLSGHHYFSGTPPKPTFDLNTPSHQYGLFIDQKLNSIPAPNPTHDVPWLELSGDKNLIFRVKTAGGLPPVTCNGAPRVLTVDYAAQYWIYKTLA